MTRLGSFVARASLLALATCAAAPSDREAPPRASTSTSSALASASASADRADPAVSAPKTKTHTAVLSPEELARIEARGFTLSELVTGTKARTTEELHGTRFASILDELEADVASALKQNPLARVSSVLGTRLFDVQWLRSREMSFTLTGVFNRIDRKAFYEGTCGEVRFVYRLGYETKQGPSTMHGRLPLTVNVVFLLPGADGKAAGASCEGAARAWRAPAELSGAALTDWLLDRGALGAEPRKGWTLKAVETNFQTVRIQSTAHPSMGGHIEYAMHVFHATADGSSFVSAPMPNMPDAARLAKDPELRAALVATLRDPEVLRTIDLGTLSLPDRFLATRAMSVAPRGLGRATNRPFDAILTNADLEGLDLSGYETIRSPAALVRRLDGLTCAGCHQSRTLAGFHHVGFDRASDPGWSSLLSGSSTHLTADLGRRAAYVDALATSTSPDEARPHAELQGQGGAFGAPCGLGDAGFAAWTCAEGLRCLALEDPNVGMCADDELVGAPCETGVVRDGATAAKDGVAAISRRSCGASLGCSGNISGFPMGACASECAPGSPVGTCNDFVDIDGLQACLRVGLDANECGKRYVVERFDRACDADTHCRQDFVCARNTDDPSRGACVPPYFVLGLRADGYPMKR